MRTETRPGIGPTGWLATPSPNHSLAELARCCRALNLRPFVMPDFSVALVTADDYEGEPPTGDAIAAALYGCEPVPDYVPVMRRRQAE